MASERSRVFDEAVLIADARRETGLSEFGDDRFRTPLRVLLASLAEAPLNAVGTSVLSTSIGRSLTRRLLAEDCFARHPEIADERIDRPLVVVGMMRSGTTLLQRLLASDPRSYSALGWELGEPTPRPETNWNAPDPRIADAEVRSRQMREFAPGLHAIHPTDALEADEEIVFLADAFLSHVPEASCHVPAYRSWLDGQDFTPAYQYLRRMLQLLQWQKRQRGERRERWVLKTPAHLGYLDTLFSVFPDAHVIQMHRSPLETIPSGASLNSTLWRLCADDVDPKQVGRQWLERMAWATRRGLAVRDRMPAAAERFTDVWYRAAASEPLAQVERIYSAIGAELIPEARGAMERWLRADRRNEKPKHRYSAEQFGLSETTICAAFTDYMDRFIDPSEHT
ncbi:MAG: sulfotransferase [Deltaproteobacteria bacterium]|nr:sulfotransferase [Deltaproteobacteria bacterium]